jgi:hypothetical protein
MEMKAAVEAEAKATMKATAKAAAQATAKATVRVDRQARPPKRALPQEVVMREELAAQAEPTWAIPAPHLPAWATAIAARLLVVYAG